MTSKRRPWGCVALCVGEASAVVAGFFFGVQTASTNPHNGGPMLAVVAGIVYAVAFGFGWPTLYLLAVMAWRAIRALDRWQNRVKPPK
jgi:hypothetical protein